MQYDVTMKQISSHSNLSLIIQTNSYNGFTRPVNHDKLSRYIYMGFIPANLANSNTIQGYNVNNNDYKFLNCDKNPNSYLVFYYNDFHRYPAGYYKNCCYSELIGQWINQSKPTKSYLPQDYFFQTEMHMGGCGGYAVSGYKNQANIVGAALGFPFGKSA
ncbi:hypothetical protein FSP39_017461 [Pinctada imbricata]|uniref:Uncharacterized protein n=1 Tax=Pinctada imbricata TaxID=66713 RepID=A0AA89CDG0_PINIB|nr:hypothetical protein FSP39_017461 [Pinctada imbricata]